MGALPVVHGLVWGVDAVGFSRRVLADQVAIIEFLSRYVTVLADFDDLPRDDYIVHSTGDGFLVTLIDHPGLPAQLLRAAAGLVNECRSWRSGHSDVPLKVRQGLHAGQFMHPVRIFGGEEAVGDGLNLGSRIADAAGPDQIYVSETFVQYVVNTHGTRGLGRSPAVLYPPLSSPPHKLPLKHGAFAGVRHVVLPGVEWHVPSPILMRQYETEQKLREQLHLILKVAEGAVAQSSGASGGPPLDVRASIWRLGRDHLVATRLRIQWDGAAPESRIGRYAMHPLEGPLARAVASQRPIVEVGLPDGTDRPGAEARWEALGLRPHRFAQLGRLPGTLLAVPFAFGSNGVRGAICIDMAPPLTGSEDVLTLIAGLLMQREGGHIAALMQLRSG